MATVTPKVAAGTDDGGTIGASGFINNPNTLRVGEDNNGDDYSTFIRLQVNDIPQGATINDATLKMIGNAGDDSGPNATFDIYGEAADNPAAPTSQSDFDGRTRTTATTRAFEQTVATGTEYNFDVTAIVQEIVNRAGWAAGNYLIIFLDADTTATGTDDRVAYDSYDGSTTNAPEIEIDYTAAGTTVSPAIAEVNSATLDPVVVRSSLTISPAIAEASNAVLLPSIIHGNLTLSPARSNATGVATGPIVVKGSLTIGPAIASVAISAIEPTVSTGGNQVISPAIAEALAQALLPSVIKSSMALSPDPVNSNSAAILPQVVEGSIALTPDIAAAASQVLQPTVDAGSGLTLTPGIAEAKSETLKPAVIQGSLTITPTIAAAAVESLGGKAARVIRFSINVKPWLTLNTMLQQKMDYQMEVKESA